MSGEAVWTAGLEATRLLRAGKPRAALREVGKAVRGGGGGWALLLRARAKQARVPLAASPPFLPTFLPPDFPETFFAFIPSNNEPGSCR